MKRVVLFLILPIVSRASPRIVGGAATDISAYPYQLSLQFSSHHICGSALVSQTKAISAAHCFQKSGSYSIKAGVTNLNTMGTVIPITMVVIHPKYNKKTSDYDIAVLYFQTPIIFSDTIQPVALPPISRGYELKSGMIGSVAGWGYTSLRTLSENSLQVVEVPVVDWQQCRKIYFQGITERMFCAGFMEGGLDACLGDSGGGFVVNGILYGIVSAGIGCATPGFPGIYTNVFALREFIKEYALI